MNIEQEQAYRIKSDHMKLELIKNNNITDKDLYNLYMLYWDIMPNSYYWRHGYKRSIKKAIIALGGKSPTAFKI